jgi:hypothetical protein
MAVAAALRAIELWAKVYQFYVCGVGNSQIAQAGFAEDTKTAARARAHPKRVLAETY